MIFKILNVKFINIQNTRGIASKVKNVSTKVTRILKNSQVLDSKAKISANAGIKAKAEQAVKVLNQRIKFYDHFDYFRISSNLYLKHMNCDYIIWTNIDYLDELVHLLDIL